MSKRRVGVNPFVVCQRYYSSIPTQTVTEVLSPYIHRTVLLLARRIHFLYHHYPRKTFLYLHLHQAKIMINLSRTLWNSTSTMSAGRPKRSQRQVSLSFTNASILVDLVQDNFRSIDDDIHRVRIEPERTGWARIYDLVGQFDKDRVIDVKEDIDTFLVFVSLSSYFSVSELIYYRPVCSQQSLLRSSSNHTRTCNNNPRI